MCMEPETTTVVGECPIHGGGVCTVCENGPEAHVLLRCQEAIDGSYRSPTGSYSCILTGQLPGKSIPSR